MRIPKTPPSIEDIFNDIIKSGDYEAVQQLLKMTAAVNTHDQYHHWEKIRFSQPFSEFSPEENWLIIKQARRATMRHLPFDPIHQREHPLHFTRPDCLLSSLNRLDMQMGGTVTTHSQSISKPDALRYLQKSFLEEPFSSSVLEGAVTTRERARALIETGAPPKNLSDRMVVNNYQAMSFIKQHLDDPLTPRLILECQEIISQDTLDRPEMAGQLRDNDNVTVVDMDDQDIHVPPSYKSLPRRLELICEFANAPADPNRPYFHPLVKAVILHFMIAYDHPFVDGNGRTARALFYWFALRSGYWMIEYVSISSVIKDAPKQYGLAFLHSETDQNDLTYFILHQLDVLEKAISNLQNYMARQRKIYNTLERNLNDDTLNHRQKSLLSNMIRGQVSSAEISVHVKHHNVSYITARKDLEDLTQNGWLKKVKRGRNSYYEKGRKLGALIRG